MGVGETRLLEIVHWKIKYEKFFAFMFSHKGTNLSANGLLTFKYNFFKYA